MTYYSARLLYVILVGDGRARRRVHCDETVVVFRARDPFDAFDRALEVGRARETEYRNHLGQRVRWALAEVSTIDRIGRRLDGAEVASKLHYRVLSKPISVGTRLHPERSRPGNASPAGELGSRRDLASRAPSRRKR